MTSIAERPHPRVAKTSALIAIYGPPPQKYTTNLTSLNKFLEASNKIKQNAQNSVYSVLDRVNARFTRGVGKDLFNKVRELTLIETILIKPLMDQIAWVKNVYGR